MARVLIVYASDWGSTQKMAQVIAKGVESVAGAEAVITLAEEATVKDVTACDALVIGTPVHMGSMDWRVKKFIDQICSALWMEDKMAGKVGAIFVTGSGYGNAGGGCELTMLSMLNNLAELGLVLIPLPKNTPGYAKGGLQWGPYGRSMTEEMQPMEGGVPDERLEAARNHGANVARAALALEGRNIFEE